MDVVMELERQKRRKTIVEMEGDGLLSCLSTGRVAGRHRYGYGCTLDVPSESDAIGRPQSAADEPQLQRQSHSVCDKSRAGLGRLELEELRNCVCPATSIQDEKNARQALHALTATFLPLHVPNIPSFSLVAMHAGAKMRWRCFFRPSLQQHLSTIAHSQPPRFSARY